MRVQQTLEEENVHSYMSAKPQKCSPKTIFKNFCKIVKGDPEILCRSANILHVLGSVSVSTELLVEKLS